MQWLDAGAVSAATPYPALIDALAEAFRKKVSAPPRWHHEIQNDDRTVTTLLVMPCWQAGGRFGVKLVTVVPANSARGLPTVQAAYLVGSSVNGSFDALLDGTELTLRRTAAASALASRYLSRHDSQRLLIVGSGNLAAPLARAHRAVRSIREIRIWSRSREHATRLAESLAGELKIPVAGVADLAESTSWADIISCATLSTEALVLGRNLRPGQHLDLVGAYTPSMRETDDEAVARARIFVDSRDSALAEAGDLIQALKSGAITAADIRGELAELARNEIAGRQAGSDITLFKSVGLALEDLAAAELALDSH